MTGKKIENEDQLTPLQRRGGTEVAHGGLYVKVRGKPTKRYDVVAGMPPGWGRKDNSHYYGPTPVGEFELGGAQHHRSRKWIRSVVPWDADLRYSEHKDPDTGELEIEFSTDGLMRGDPRKRWHIASGKHGVLFPIMMREWLHERPVKPMDHEDRKEAERLVAAWTRSLFYKADSYNRIMDESGEGVARYHIKEGAYYDPSVKQDAKAEDKAAQPKVPTVRFVLPQKYESSDFGSWAFQLKQVRHPRPGEHPRCETEAERKARYKQSFIHMTQMDYRRQQEIDADVKAQEPGAEKRHLHMRYSHGCIHVEPHDLEEMMKEGYLQRGVRLTVHPYSTEPGGDRQAKSANPNRDHEPFADKGQGE